MQTLAEASHLPLYRIPLLLREVQHSVQGDMESRLAGQKPKTQNHGQRKLNTRILNLVRRYADISLPHFLIGMAHNVRGIIARRHESFPKEIDDQENVLTQPITTPPPPAIPTRKRKAAAPTPATAFDDQFSKTTTTSKRRRHN